LALKRISEVLKKGKELQNVNMNIEASLAKVMSNLETSNNKMIAFRDEVEAMAEELLNLHYNISVIIENNNQVLNNLS
jgi:predicted  nucleic acid-binding Zn-ribbon protein